MDFECILEVFWEYFWMILGSASAQQSPWMLSERFVCVGSRFNQFDSPHLGGFWEAFTEVFADIFLLSFLDIDFDTGLHLFVR